MLTDTAAKVNDLICMMLETSQVHLPWWKVRSRCYVYMSATLLSSAGPWRNDTEALHNLWQRHLHRQRVMQQQQQQSSAGGSGKQQMVQVMVVQPGDELAIGTQLPNPRELAVELQKGSDRELAAKMVDEASSRDAAYRPSSS